MYSTFQNLIGIERAPDDIAVVRPNESQAGRRGVTLTNGSQRTRARLRPRPVGRTEVYAFRSEEVQAIIRVLNDKPRDLALFLMGINTGLRAQDLARLAWEDVTRHGEIAESARIWNSTKLVYEGLKIWNFGADPKEALCNWKKHTKDSELVFPGHKGACMTIHQLNNLVKSWAAQAGVDARPYGTHSLRKTHGQRLYLAGYDIPELRKMFKQSSESYTAWYFRV